MTFACRFGSLALFIFLLPVALVAVPLHPDTEAQLNASGQLGGIRATYHEARSRGLDAPTPYPVDMKAVSAMDRTDLKVLTILVDFSDNPADTVQYPAQYYEGLLYSLESYPTGSLRDYYVENSYSEVHIVGEVAGWYRMPQTYAYYVNNNYGFGLYPQNAQKLTEDAVMAADPDVDFSQYDNDNDGYVDALFIVHAGSGAEQTGNPNQIWSHAWVTYNVPYVDGVYAYSYSAEPENGHVGVFAHELGHALFGLPDLYDYGYDSAGTGFWSLMSAGCWGGGGVTPVHLDAWSKIKAGFVQPSVVESDQTDVIIPQVETADVIYRLWTEGAPGSQYFLIENRQPVGFDVSLPSHGLLIYHIEEQSGSNNNQWYPGYTSNGHYLVAVEQADGDWDLEHNANSGDAGDPWPGSMDAAIFDGVSVPDSRDYNFQSTSVAVKNISASADTMTADFQVGLYLPTGLDVTVTPDDYPIVLPNAGGAISYQVEVDNHDSTVEQTQFWAMAILPNGSLFGPVTGPYDLAIAGGGTLVGNFTQIVPGRAPSGHYLLIGYVGVYPSSVQDSSSFAFDKGPAGSNGGGSPQLDDWSSSGGFASDRPDAPAGFEITGAYPNPFNPTTVLSFKLQEASFVNLAVYDVSGRKVVELVNGWRDAGQSEAMFDGSNLGSGVYLYRISAGKFNASGKMVLMK